ncbi:MAG: nucleotidyltransferase [candidate division KSB1 bacterium]|nr:nucleotidyltransferase [candidate division KSB1 bacterium]
MEKTLKVINQMQKKKVIAKYAIGGGIAAIFYIEPILTYDLDIFVFLPQTEHGLVTLSPLYEFLKKKGYQTSHEHIIIEGVPVQFIPAYNQLIEEAITQARETKYKRTKTKVIRVEHLLAIMLQTDRPKDRTRITQLLEQAKINMDYLLDIFKRHGLLDKWQRFRKRFYGK